MCIEPLELIDHLQIIYSHPPRINLYSLLSIIFNFPTEMTICSVATKSAWKVFEWMGGRESKQNGTLEHSGHHLLS